MWSLGCAAWDGSHDPFVRLALAQLNLVVGDLEGNAHRIIGGIAEAKASQAELVLLPELAITGYPPEDLLLRPGFIKAAAEALEEVARACVGITALVGCPSFESMMLRTPSGWLKSWGSARR